MPDFGAMFIADDGSLLVTSDSPVYEYRVTINPTSRSGNVSVYGVTTTGYPLIFVQCGTGKSAGVLSIEGSPGAWTVTVLTDISCPILAFTTLTSVSTSGVGLAVYGATGEPVFDTTKKVLNARKIGVLAENTSFQSVGGTNMVAYTAGPVWPSQSTSSSWVTVDYYPFTYFEYVCRQVLEYVCTTEYQYVCGPDGFCSYQPYQSCSYQYVTRCAYETQYGTAIIQALVVRTDWTIRRGTAFIGTNAVISFAWLVHKTGYYNEITQFRTINFNPFNPGSNGLPPGYQVPASVFPNSETYVGELTKNNKYPYTTSRANTGSLTCITGVSSDYA